MTDPLILVLTLVFVWDDSSFKFSESVSCISDLASPDEGAEGRRRFRNAFGVVGTGLAIRWVVLAENE